jgi:hypothetical protein
VKPEIAAAFYKRLGNLVLLKAQKNSNIGNNPFSLKKPELLNSTNKLTELAGTAVAWGPDEIEARQETLAELAVKTWPIK